MLSLEKHEMSFITSEPDIHTILGNLLYPRKLCLWVGILFSRCPSVRSSVTFCFLNIFKSQ